LVSVRFINLVRRDLFFLPILFPPSISTVDGMETTNSGTGTSKQNAQAAQAADVR